MVFDFVVLGATGIQGRIASRDLLENDHSVLLCGRDEKKIDLLLEKYRKAEFEYVDLRDMKNTADVIKKSGAKVVLNCAEGDWDMNAMKACIKADAHYLDLGSDIPMTRDQFKLDPVLKKKKLISITGCGSTPGVNNVMLRHAVGKLDKVHCVDAGFAWDSNMKTFVVPFSIQSIVEEFTDIATIMHNKKFLKVTPREYFMEHNFREIGREKSFYTRHPEVYTFCRFLKKKNVCDIKFFASFPKHSYDTIMTLIKLGFSSKEPVMVDGKEVVPVRFLTEFLKRLEIPKGYTEKENLWIRVHGRKDGKKKSIYMNCVVPTLKGWEDSTCNIDTGMPASIMAQMVKEGFVKEHGSFSPEFVIPPKPFFEELARRKMSVYENGRKIN